MFARVPEADAMILKVSIDDSKHLFYVFNSSNFISFLKF